MLLQLHIATSDLKMAAADDGSRSTNKTKRFSVDDDDNSLNNHHEAEDTVEYGLPLSDVYKLALKFYKGILEVGYVSRYL